MVLPHAGQLVGLRTPGILGSRVDGDPNVLCTLTSAKALDRGILGYNSNGVAEGCKVRGFPCLPITRKIFYFASHCQAWGKESLVPRQAE